MTDWGILCNVHVEDIDGLSNCITNYDHFWECDPHQGGRLFSPATNPGGHRTHLTFSTPALLPPYTSSPLPLPSITCLFTTSNITVDFTVTVNKAWSSILKVGIIHGVDKRLLSLVKMKLICSCVLETSVMLEHHCVEIQILLVVPTHSESLMLPLLPLSLSLAGSMLHACPKKYTSKLTP